MTFFIRSSKELFDDYQRLANRIDFLKGAIQNDQELIIEDFLAEATSAEIELRRLNERTTKYILQEGRPR